MAHHIRLDNATLKKQFGHEEIFGQVEINERLWRNDVIESVEIALAQIKYSWRDGVTLFFKLRKINLLNFDAEPKTPEIEIILGGSNGSASSS